MRLRSVLCSGKYAAEGRKEGTKEGNHWSRYDDEELRQLVRERESLLFELFPEFDERPPRRVNTPAE